MASSSQPATCGLVKPTGENLDIAWKWNSLKDIKDRKSVTCDFCHKTTTRGITRAKRHQMGITGDVGACRKIPPEVRALLKEEFERKKGLKDDAAIAELIEEQDQMADLQEIMSIQKGGKRPQNENSIDSIAKKKSNVKGPLDALLFRDPETTIKLGKATKQTNIKDGFDKEARTRTIQYIERFLITNMIPFNVVNSKSFHLMLAAVGNYGHHLKGPTYHECRVPLLKSELQYTKELMKGHEEERTLYGCSIMSDGWTDRKNRTLINFLVNCPKGSMFVRSVDASGYMKTGERIFELLDSFVEEIGESNVVQVISDNGSNYKMAGQKWGQADNLRYDCCFICVDTSLPVLDRYVEQRVDCMMDAGLLNEVYDIYTSNADYTRGLRQAIGVREFEPLLRTCVVDNINCSKKELTDGSSLEKGEPLLNGNLMERLRSLSDAKSLTLLEEAIEKVKVNTRRLVRRQKRMLNRLQTLFGWNIHYVDSTESSLSKSNDVWTSQVVESATLIVKSFLSENGSLLSTSGMSNDTGTKIIQRDLWTQYTCKACSDRVLRGLHEWEQHIRGRGHRKRISSLRSKAQGLRFVEQKLELSEFL